MAIEFGFSMNAFRQYNLLEGIEILAENGYDGIEILLDEPHLYPSTANDEDIDRVLGALDEHGLAISNCNAFMLSAIERTELSREATYGRETEQFHHPSFIEPAIADRHNRIDHTKAALEIAAALGATHISIQPGGPVPEGMPRQQALELFVTGLQEVANTAERVDVDVLVEPEPLLLIETSDDFLALMDRIDSPRVGCNFDAGHFFCVDEDPTELIDTLSPYTGHYHLEDIPADRTHKHTQLGDGGMDIDEFLEAVEASDYDDFVTIELYPYEDTAMETVGRAMDYLEDHGWV